MIVRPNLFLQDIPELTIPSPSTHLAVLRQRRAGADQHGGHRDVAAVAAVALTEPGHAGAHYDVTGPEALSYADVAAKLSAMLGRPISYVDVPDDLQCGRHCWASVSASGSPALVGLYQDYRRSGTDGYAAQVTEDRAQLTGRPARSLDDLLGEIAPSLRVPAPRQSVSVEQIGADRQQPVVAQMFWRVGHILNKYPSTFKT